MTWQGVPWFVAGGIHPPEVARLLAHAATSGAEGVVGAGDLKVRARDVPTSEVAALSGAALIPNRATGGGQQSYIARNPDEDVVEVSPTGAGAGRSDLVIARVEDPQYPGTENAADPANGPYVFTRIIEGVGPSVTDIRQVAGHETDSAITLARIDLPASTGTVLDAHIVDLRIKSQPRRERALLIASPDASQTQTATAAAGENWPVAASWQVRVPEWATRVKMVGTWGQILVPAGNVTGNLWVRLGATAEPDAVVGQIVRYDTPGSTQNLRLAFVSADDLPIPAGLRGKTIDAHLRGQNTYILSGGNGARMKADDVSAFVLDLEFIESAE